MFSWIAAKLGSTVLEYVIGGALITILAGGGYLYISHLHSAKIKAEAQAEAARKGLQIGYEGYVKLYQEREKIKTEKAQERRKVNELQNKLDYYGLSDIYNQPDGLRSMPKPTGGQPKTPSRYRSPGGTGPSYRTAP